MPKDTSKSQDPNSQDLDNAAADMIARFEKNGAASTTVKDGHILMFKRSYLEKILKDNHQDAITIFLQTKSLN